MRRCPAALPTSSERRADDEECDGGVRRLFRTREAAAAALGDVHLPRRDLAVCALRLSGCRGDAVAAVQSENQDRGVLRLKRWKVVVEIERPLLERVDQVKV